MTHIFNNSYFLREIVEFLGLSDIKTLSNVDESFQTILELSIFDDIKKEKTLEYLTEWIKSIDSHNRYTDLTPEQLKTLETLDLYGNQLTAIPPELGQLSNLRELDLHDNNLTCMPQELGNLCSLQTLDLGFNFLTLIPSEIDHMSSLRLLYLYGNDVEDFQSENGITRELIRGGLTICN